jgi:serine/threonine protein kinase
MEKATMDLQNKIIDMENESDGKGETILVFQAMFALQSFHAFKGTFNDVKPSNFLLVPTPDKCIVYPIRRTDHFSLSKGYAYTSNKDKHGKAEQQEYDVINVMTGHKVVLCDFANSSFDSLLGHQLPNGITTIAFSAPEVIVGGPEFPLTQARDVFSMFFVVMPVLTRQEYFTFPDEEKAFENEVKVWMKVMDLDKKIPFSMIQKGKEEKEGIAKQLYIYAYFLEFNGWRGLFDATYASENLLPSVNTDAHSYLEFCSWLDTSFMTACKTLGIRKDLELCKLFRTWITQMLHPVPTSRPTMGELLLRLMPVFEPQITGKKEADNN